MEGLVWVVELNAEMIRCMKPFVVALALLLWKINGPGKWYDAIFLFPVYFLLVSLPVCLGL